MIRIKNFQDLDQLYPKVLPYYLRMKGAGYCIGMAITAIVVYIAASILLPFT